MASLPLSKVAGSAGGSLFGVEMTNFAGTQLEVGKKALVSFDTDSGEIGVVPTANMGVSKVQSVGTSINGWASNFQMGQNKGDATVVATNDGKIIVFALDTDDASMKDTQQAGGNLRYRVFDQTGTELNTGTVAHGASYGQAGQSPARSTNLKAVELKDGLIAIHDSRNQNGAGRSNVYFLNFVTGTNTCTLERNETISTAHVNSAAFNSGDPQFVMSDDGNTIYGFVHHGESNAGNHEFYIWGVTGSVGAYAVAAPTIGNSLESAQNFEGCWLKGTYKMFTLSDGKIMVFQDIGGTSPATSPIRQVNIFNETTGVREFQYNLDGVDATGVSSDYYGLNVLGAIKLAADDFLVVMLPINASGTEIGNDGKLWRVQYNSGDNTITGTDLGNISLSLLEGVSTSSQQDEEKTTGLMGMTYNATSRRLMLLGALSITSILLDGSYNIVPKDSYCFDHRMMYVPGSMEERGIDLTAFRFGNNLMDFINPTKIAYITGHNFSESSTADRREFFHIVDLRQYSTVGVPFVTVERDDTGGTAIVVPSGDAELVTADNTMTVPSADMCPLSDSVLLRSPAVKRGLYEFFSPIWQPRLTETEANGNIKDLRTTVEFGGTSLNNVSSDAFFEVKNVTGTYQHDEPAFTIENPKGAVALTYGGDETGSSLWYSYNFIDVDGWTLLAPIQDSTQMGNGTIGYWNFGWFQHFDKMTFHTRSQQDDAYIMIKYTEEYDGATY